MGAGEPRVRRRGFFLHSDTGEPETGELENAEGFVVRVHLTNAASSHHRFVAGVPGARFRAAGRANRSIAPRRGLPAIRSGSVTGSRQRAHLPR